MKMWTSDKYGLVGQMANRFVVQTSAKVSERFRWILTKQKRPLPLRGSKAKASVRSTLRPFSRARPAPPRSGGLVIPAGRPGMCGMPAVWWKRVAGIIRETAFPESDGLPSAHGEIGDGVVVGLEHFGVVEDFVAKRVEAVQGHADVGGCHPVLSHHTAQSGLNVTSWSKEHISSKANHYIQFVKKHFLFINVYFVCLKE